MSQRKKYNGDWSKNISENFKENQNIPGRQEIRLERGKLRWGMSVRNSRVHNGCIKENKGVKGFSFFCIVFEMLKYGAIT